ncbi:MAG: lipopolysaccharide heptosyltransferase II [Mariprofundus sp.]|nr:lipopolysaccharide heptosyltransferase II [Mariprofundus sp.]
MKQVNHLLLMPPNWIGDVIMAQPAMRAICLHYQQLNPDIRISVCGRSWLSELLPWLNLPLANFTASPIKADIAFLLPNSFRSAWQCRLAGVGQLIGYRGQWRRLLLSNPLPHRISLKHQHHRDSYLDIASQLSIATEQRHVQLQAPENALQRGKQIMISHDLDPERVITMAPGAQFGAAKCYPQESFRNVCQALAAKGWQPLILGMPADHQTGEAMVAELSLPHWNGAGKTTLAQALQLIAASRLMLCNDSGLMHVAAGLGIPTVAPFGATDPKRTAPSGNAVTIVYKPADCSPCLQRECSTVGHPCMNNITPQMLTDACLSLLSS